MFWSDEVLARRFAAEVEGDLKFSDQYGWIMRDGAVWRRDEGVREAGRRCLSVIGELVDEDARSGGALTPKARASMLSTSRLNAVLRMAKMFVDCVGPDQVDSADTVITTPSREIQLGDAIVGHVSTRCTHVDPSDEESVAWLRFVTEVFGDEQSVYLKRCAGYWLTGSTREQKIFVLKGGTGLGKSTFISVLARAFGSYAWSASRDTFRKQSGALHPAEVASMKGNRLVYVDEIEEDAEWDAGRLKALSGQKVQNARFMNQNPFQFRMTGKLVFLLNRLPPMRLEPALRRRIEIIEAVPREVVPDLDLEERLMKEAPGVLRWAINGAVDWSTQGLRTPASVRERTQELLSGGAVMRFVRALRSGKKKRFSRGEIRDLWSEAHGRCDDATARQIYAEMRSAGFVDRPSNGTDFLVRVQHEPSTENPEARFVENLGLKEGEKIYRKQIAELADDYPEVSRTRIYAALRESGYRENRDSSGARYFVAPRSH